MKVFARQIISQCPTEPVAPHTLCAWNYTSLSKCSEGQDVQLLVSHTSPQSGIYSVLPFFPSLLVWKCWSQSASNRNENTKVRIYQTKRFTSTKIFWAFLYKIAKFQSRKGLKSKPAWEAEGHLCIQMSKTLMFWTSLVIFTLIIVSVQSDWAIYNSSYVKLSENIEFSDAFKEKLNNLACLDWTLILGGGITSLYCWKFK